MLATTPLVVLLTRPFNYGVISQCRTQRNLLEPNNIGIQLSGNLLQSIPSLAFIINHSQNQDSEYGNARLSKNIVIVFLDQVVEMVYQEHDIDYEFKDEDLSGIAKFLNL